MGLIFPVSFGLCSHKAGSAPFIFSELLGSVLFAWINYHRNFSVALGEDLLARLFGWASV